METHHPDVNTIGLKNLCNDDEARQVLGRTVRMRKKAWLLVLQKRHLQTVECTLSRIGYQH